MRRAPWLSKLLIVNYCCTRVLLYAKMLKKTENEETRFFWQIFAIGGIVTEGARVLSATPWLFLWFWDKIAPLSSFIKKKHLKRNWNNLFSKTWRTWVKSLNRFLKRPRIAWHYYDVNTWSLLLRNFVRVNPKLKKLQNRTRTTYWLCSHYIYHW